MSRTSKILLGVLSTTTVVLAIAVGALAWHIWTTPSPPTSTRSAVGDTIGATAPTTSLPDPTTTTKPREEWGYVAFESRRNLQLHNPIFVSIAVQLEQALAAARQNSQTYVIHVSSIARAVGNLLDDFRKFVPANAVDRNLQYLQDDYEAALVELLNAARAVLSEGLSGAETLRAAAEREEMYWNHWRREWPSTYIPPESQQ